MRQPEEWTGLEWSGTGVGVLAAALLKRIYYPKLSHLWASPIYLVAAIVSNNLGRGIDYLNESRKARNRQIIYDYVKLHPEDFTEEKKKYKDLLLPWSPIRR